MTQDWSSTNGYNGFKCDPNSINADYHSEKFRKIINSPEFQRPGWSLNIEVYNIGNVAGIPLTPFFHSTVTLRKDGQLVTSLDLWSLDKKTGAATFYASGERFSPVLDDCIADNVVVKPNGLVAKGALRSGTGADVIVPFAEMVEFANYARGKKLDYEKFPDSKIATQSNSNGIPAAYAHHAGVEIPKHVQDVLDSRVTAVMPRAPGAHDNLYNKIWPKEKVSAYEEYEADPQRLLANPAAMENFFKEMDNLHLGKEQQDICLESGTNECAVPLTPLPTSRR